MSRLKILFLPSWYPSVDNPVSGIFIREHAKAVSLYNEVVILYSERCDRSIKGLYKIISDRREDGIRTIRIKHRKSPIPKTTYLIYLWSIWRIFQKLIKEGWKSEIIHAHVFAAGVPAVILGKIYKIPVIITEHFTAFPRHTLKRINVLKAKFAMNRAQVILPVSDNLGKHIQSYGIHNRFQVVFNVVNTELFYPDSNINKRKTKRILLVALLDPKKGVPYLLQSLSKLKKKRGDFILDIVGDGAYRLEYEKQTRDLDIADKVNFHGLKPKEEIAEFMRRSDFFVLPSLWENLPCVLIEAMASGLPIVATNVGGIPEIINKDTGILVPPKDIDALAEAIDYMLDHYQNYSPEKISQYAKENFSYEVVGKKLDSIYRNVKRYEVGK